MLFLFRARIGKYFPRPCFLCLSDLILTCWRHKSFFSYLFTCREKLISIVRPQFSGQEGRHFLLGLFSCFRLLTGVCVSASLHVCVHRRAPSVCGHTSFTMPPTEAEHGGNFNQGSQQTWWASTGECPHLCVCLCACVCVCCHAKPGKGILENVPGALWWSIKTNPAGDKEALHDPRVTSCYNKNGCGWMVHC